MARAKLSTRVWQSVDVECDVDLSPEEIFKAMNEEAKAELAVLMGYSHSPGEQARMVESAYLKARSMNDCPQEFKDLFWYVHGRPMA